MKKLLAITLSLIMILAIVSCGNNAEPADTSADTSASVDNSLPFNITVISGTTGMGFAKMMSDTKNGASAFP